MTPYQPDELPLQNKKDWDWPALVSAVGEANAELARYDGLLQGIVNPSIMLSPLTNQEAMLSSKIEGTQATVDEVLEYEAGIDKEAEKVNDIYEIINYRKALRDAHDSLSQRPITLGVIRELHKILLDSVRGRDKNPGQFRSDQNWIGRPGAKIEEATFIPPSPLQLQDYLEKWQIYVEGNDMDVLIQTAIIHAQFELIHPFRATFKII